MALKDEPAASPWEPDLPPFTQRIPRDELAALVAASATEDPPPPSGEVILPLVVRRTHLGSVRRSLMRWWSGL